MLYWVEQTALNRDSQLQSNWMTVGKFHKEAIYKAIGSIRRVGDGETSYGRLTQAGIRVHLKNLAMLSSLNSP